ncbi:MAG: glycosyl hydrolase, repeat protein [Ramlibacter sp.]|nr:glycosyl hydrolase, repeat protein [Ramlibacter sp.]MDF2462232.1 glycosyl hydrolase, repeat protein [Ramlibacter sp.]
MSPVLSTRRALLTAAAAAVVLPARANSPAAGSVVADPLDAPARASRLAARSALMGVARAGDALVAVGERGHVLRSDDGGERWTQVGVPTSVTLTAVGFADARSGWACGHGGVLLHTADGGRSWRKQLDGRALLAGLQARRGGSAALDQQLARWREEGPDKPFLDLHVYGAEHVIAVGAYGLAVETRDGGRNWQPLPGALDNPGERHLYALAVHGGATYAAGEQGLLLRRAGTGQRFEAVTTAFRSTVFALIATEGALLALGLGGWVHRSTDDGLHWASSQPAGRAALTAAWTRGATVVVASESGSLLVSGDAGRNFSVVPALRPAPLTGLAAAGPGRIVAVGLLGPQVIALG